MNKKILAAAVASVFAAPAFAQVAPNNVVLYGRLNTGLDNASATGSYLNSATVNHDWKDRNRVWDTGSRLGVRGTEDLGNGLRAVFQIESGLNSNNGQSTSEASQYNTSAGTLASRPTWVGLEGNWGRVLFGRQDVYWGDGTIDQTGANYVDTDIPWLTNNTGRVSVGVARQSNVVSYTTPTMGGANASIYYSPDSGTSGAVSGASNQEDAGPGKNTNSRLEAITGRWAGGPFQAQYDWVYKQAASDFISQGLLNAQAKSWGNKLGLAWAYMPGGQIAIIGTHIVATQITGADITGSLTLKQNTLSLNWEQLVSGNILLLAQFGHQFNASGCDGEAVPGVHASNPGIVNPTNYGQVCLHSGATAIMMGARYNLSKRTGVYATLNHMQNGQNSFADYGGGAYAVGSSVPQVTSTSQAGTLAVPGASGVGQGSKGAHINIVAIGIQHNF
jgi:predicted porin